MKNLESELAQLLADVTLYNVKPNKSLSGRIRAQLGKLKKDVTGLRSDLVKADHNGYK